MDNKVTITEEPEDPALTRQMARFRRNGEWLTEHGALLFAQFRGRYIAVSEGEVFAADDAEGARRLALARHPHDEPFVQYVPEQSYERIYAH